MKFTATMRSVQGSSASRRLRRAGRVPAIVYGGHEAPANIELDHNEIFHALNREEFHSSIVDMDLDGKTQSVLVRSVQWHPYKPFVLHVDFQRVSATEVLTTRVPLHYRDADECPAVRVSGQVINTGPVELEISCIAADLPQFIAVELGAMEADDRIYLSDIELPEGVTFVPRGEDTDPLLAQAVEPRITIIEDEVEEAVETDESVTDEADDAEEDEKKESDD